MSSPTNHLALQLAILQALEQGDNAVRKGRLLVKNPKDSQQHLHNLRNQHLNTAFRSIADGIAWRTLEFNRFHLRILSQARSPGAADKKVGRVAEREMAKRVAEELGDQVLFNDATNILRVGDLTFVKLDKKHHPYLAEMKMRRGKMVLSNIKSIGKKLDSGKALSTQEKRLWQAQKALIRNEFAIAGQPAVKVLETQPGKPKHYMRKVNRLLVKANAEGAAEGFVSKYIYVSAVDVTFYKKGGTLNAGPSRAPKNLQPIMTWNNYEMLSLLKQREVARSSAPYTTFPFSVANVTKLLLGEILLQTVIYLQPLADEFKRLGWELVFDTQELDKYDSNENDRVKHFSGDILFPDEGFKGGNILMLHHPTNGFKWPIYQFVSQMVHEFISADYIASVANEIMRASKPGVNAHYVVDNNDTNRWI